MKDYVIPAAFKGEVVFPEHNEFNAKSSIRAFSGISKTYLIEEALQTRVTLVKELLCYLNRICKNILLLMDSLIVPIQIIPSHCYILLKNLLNTTITIRDKLFNIYP